MLRKGGEGVAKEICSKGILSLILFHFFLMKNRADETDRRNRALYSWMRIIDRSISY